VHISDNNRYFPGFGAIDFSNVFNILKEMNYQGQIVIEGNIQQSFTEDIRRSADFLAQLLTP